MRSFRFGSKRRQQPPHRDSAAALGDSLDAIIARNGDQATAFGFKGTPSFIVGKFRVPGVLTMAQFDQAIADARKAAAQK